MGRLKIDSDFNQDLLFALTDPFHSRAPIASSVVLNAGSNQHLGRERVWLVRLHYHCMLLSGSYLCVCVGKQSKRLTARKKYKIERKVHLPKTSCFRLYGNKSDCVHI